MSVLLLFPHYEKADEKRNGSLRAEAILRNQVIDEEISRAMRDGKKDIPPEKKIVRLFGSYRKLLLGE